jgi:hypothetical protein
MKARLLLALAAALFAAVPPAATAQAKTPDMGYWVPVNSSARTITGELALFPTRLTLNLINFPVAPIHALTPAEIRAVFPGETPDSGGNLYRVRIPAAQRFLNHNTLCGTDQAEWLVTTLINRQLYVAFFSGTEMPVFTPEALEKSSDLHCGTFSYSR